MVTSDSDKVNEAPSCVILMKVTIDNFTGEEYTDEQMSRLSVELANAWSGQVMTNKSLITYEAMPIKDFVWLDQDDIDDHKA